MRVCKTQILSTKLCSQKFCALPHLRLEPQCKMKAKIWLNKTTTVFLLHNDCQLS